MRPDGCWMGLAGLWAVWVGERTSGRRPVVLWANVTGCLWPNKMSLSFLSLASFIWVREKERKVSRAPSELAALLKKSQRIIIKSDAKSRRAFRRSFFLFLLLPRILLSQLICLATSYAIYFSHNRHVRLMHLRSVETHPKRIQRRERDQHDTTFHSLKEQACRSMS